MFVGSSGLKWLLVDFMEYCVVFEDLVVNLSFVLWNMAMVRHN